MRHDDDDRRGSHVVAALNLQLILMTQVSAWGLTGEHLGTLGEVFASVGADVGAKLVGMDEDDHVHLLVASPSRVAVARLVHSSRTSRLGGYASAPPGRHSPGGAVVAVVVRGARLLGTRWRPQGLHRPAAHLGRPGRTAP